MSEKPSLPELDPSGRVLGRRTILALSLIDGALYLDCTLRWENGFGFARSAWLVACLAFLALSFLSNRGLVKRSVHGIIHALIALFTLSAAFFLAKSGIPFSEWSAPPQQPGPAFFGYGAGTSFFLEGGGVVVLLGALAHGLLGQGFRSSARRPSASAAQRWLLGLGLGLVALSFVSTFDVFGFTVLDATGEVVDPRGPTPAAREAVSTLRAGFWSSVGVLGGVLTILAGFQLIRGTRKRSARGETV